jgi:DNA topoisomerase-3
VRWDALGRDERRIFDLVARRFLGAFHPDAELAVTEAVIRVGAAAGAETAGKAPPPGDGATVDEEMIADLPPPPDRFFARGRVRLVAGWQAVAQIGDRVDEGDRAAPGGDADQRLPSLREGQRLDGRFESASKQTRPPPRHTEATLLGAMEYAGRDIEDETLRAAMRDTGLGTPATRAATIETLLKRRYLARDGKQLLPTEMGIALVHALPVTTSLASPELTGAWEARLARVARGQEKRDAFMADIARYVGDTVAAIRGSKVGVATSSRPAPPSSSPSSRPPAASSPRVAKAPAKLACPRCRQGELIAGKRGWGCSRWREGCPFVVWFEVADRRITEAELRDLVGKGKTRRRKWPAAGGAEVSGRLVLDLEAPRDNGAARFESV